MSRQRFLLVVGCLVCLLAVTVALPAADPRLDPPNAREDTTEGGWGTVVDTEDETDDSQTEDQEPPDRTDDESTTPGSEPEIRVEGRIVPGNTVQIEVKGGSLSQSRYEVTVNGEEVGRAGFSGVEARVPFATEMTVRLPEESVSETVDIPTDATIDVDGGVAQNTNATVEVRINGETVPGVTVRRDGEPAGRTGDDAGATVAVPERVGTMELRAERGPIETTESVRIPAPEIRFTSQILLPGAPAPVRVLADGRGVPNVTVAVAGGGTATTNENGIARVSLPIDSQATAAVQIGETRATATVERLYLRLTIIGVVLPGLLLGLVYTYIKNVRWGADETRVRSGGPLLAGLFLALADALDGVLGMFRKPSFTVPDVKAALPGNGISAPSLSGLVPSLPRPSLPSPGSITRGLSTGTTGPSGLLSFPNPFSSDDDSPAQSQGQPSLAEEPLGPPAPTTEVRGLFHRFLDRAGIGHRETKTPGQVARRALAAGFPAEQVRQLLSVFRRVEYDGQEPSPEQVDEARSATARLLDHHQEETEE